MKPSDRLKRKVVSRLTGDVDVYYFDEGQIDGRTARLSLGNRTILIQREVNGFGVFLNNGDLYEWVKYGKIDADLTNTIEECKHIIRSNVMWEEV